MKKTKKVEKNKSFFKKVKVFILKYWYVLLASFIAFVIVVMAFSKDGPLESLYRDLMEKYKQLAEDGKEDLQQVSDIRQQEIQEQDRLNSEYQATIETLKNKHNVEVENLSTQQTESIKDIIVETGNSPEVMADKLNEILGIPVSPRVRDGE